MNILVTGGAGFIGRHLCTALVADGHNVYSIDDYSRGHRDNHVHHVAYITGHTKDIFTLTDQLPSIDAVFHLGEGSRVTPSFSDTVQYHESIATGTFFTLQYCAQNNIKIIYAASSSMFGSEKCSWDSPYAFYKGVNVDLVQCYNKWFELNYAITYFYNVYGPAVSISDIDSFINVFEQQYKSGIPLTIVEPGTQTRCCTHVSDVVRGLIAAWKYPDNEIFHFGTSSLYSLMDIVKMFDCDHVMIPARTGDRHSGAIPEVTGANKLGWVPEYNLEDWICKIKQS